MFQLSVPFTPQHSNCKNITLNSTACFCETQSRKFFLYGKLPPNKVLLIKTGACRKQTQMTYIALKTVPGRCYGRNVVQTVEFSQWRTHFNFQWNALLKLKSDFSWSMTICLQKVLLQNSKLGSLSSNRLPSFRISMNANSFGTKSLIFVKSLVLIM